MLFPANPFKRGARRDPADGQGPNPLLQNHPLVAIHPPILYAGYVGFTIPFSFAIAALVTGRFGEGWLADVRRTTLVALGFLTVGIVLGAWWSYAVLGWGGYWGWDPVENASLLPWLTAIAFIHSVMVQERRGMLRVWNLSLVIATFCLTILGTFLTRSGVRQLGARVQQVVDRAVAADVPRRDARRSASGLIAWRGDKLRSPGPHRLAAVARGRVPAEQPAVRRRSRSSCSPARCSRCSWRRCRTSRSRSASRTSDSSACRSASRCSSSWRSAPRCRGAPRAARLLRDRLLIPAWVGGAHARRRACSSARAASPTSLAFALGAFVLASIGRSVVVGVRAPRRAHVGSGAGRDRAARCAATRASTAGCVVHVGVVVIAIALATTVGLHDQARGAARARAVGDGARLHRHVPRLAESSDRAEDDDRGRRAHAAGLDEPRHVRARDLDVSRTSPTASARPSMHTDPWHDVYLTLVSAPDDRDAGDDHARRAGRHVRDVAVDRRRDHGARHRCSRSRRRARRRAGASIAESRRRDDDEPRALAEVAT